MTNSRCCLPWLCLLLFLLTTGRPSRGAAEASASPSLQPDAGGVTLEMPEESRIAAGTLLSVSFPAAMVGPETIDLAGAPCPLRLVPDVAGTWLWKSQTDGQFTVKGPVLPGQTYAVSLAPGLRDLAGTAVAPAGWGAELRTEPFEAKADWEPTDHLSARPGVVVKFTYPVRLENAAERIYFQDRDDPAQRRPADLALRAEDREDEPEAAVLRVTPREPLLPAGRTWDLIVEDVREQASGRPTPYLKRIPLGTTAPLSVQWLGGFNLPLQPKPVIRARFNDVLDPASVTATGAANASDAAAVTVEPPVPGLAVRADDEDLVLEGDFDRTKRYQVTVGTAVRGRRGFGLAAPARWGATFRPKPSALFFPGPRVSQRSRLGLRFSFLQVHTGALTWRLASVPLEKLPAVEKRLREFENPKTNPFSGKPELDDLDRPVPQPTEPLVDLFGLAVRAEGTFPASAGDDAEDLRELRWSPPDDNGGGSVPAGVCLLEITGPTWDGRGRVGHRSLVFFSESVLTEKRTPDTVLARVANMSDGLPRPGIPVRAVSASNFELARAVTDRDGLARFAAADLRPPKGGGGVPRGGEPARLLVADTPEGPAAAFLDAHGLDDVYLPEDNAAAPGVPSSGRVPRMSVFTDRSLYRPGQTVRVRGFVRTADARGVEDGLRVPAGQPVNWKVTAGDREESVAEGTATVDAEGGWEAQWAISPDAKLGEYRLAGALGNAGDRDVVVSLHVQDYKVPLFEVSATEAGKTTAPTGNAAVAAAVAACRVRANYFSGQPVAGARVSWRIRWERRDFLRTLPESGGDDGGDNRHGEDDDDDSGHAAPDTTFQLNDAYSERAATSSPPSSSGDGDEGETSDLPETKGEARLGADGTVELRADPPENLPGARYGALWEVAVTSADGQTVAAGGPTPTSVVMRQPALLGVTAERGGDAGAAASGAGTVRVRVGAFDADDHPTQVRDVRMELFRVGTKTVRENVAPFVVRYRNTPRFTPVKSVALPEVGGPGATLDVPVDGPGRYVAVAEAPGLRRVSAELLVDGSGEGDEVPVRTETSLELRPERKEYVPGETANLLTRAPVTGVAWVSVETDRVLDTLLVPLAGNTSRIPLPVKPEYAPNAKVAVYLLRPGGDDRLPAERFASAELRVRRPDRTLDVRPEPAAPRVRPGQEVRGFIRVANGEGRPVAGADVTVWAVDDALLALGEWRAPDLAGTFYPDRPHRVKTYAALRDYVTDLPRKSLFQKGFIVGGGGEEFGAKFVRKDFQPLAFWRTGLRSDADGRVAFAFVAPDNLTRYRLIAAAQTRAGQFGEGENTVEIAKPLVVEPSLPRFLRAGDEVELRAVARQGVRDQESLGVACTTDAGLVLVNPGAGGSKGVSSPPPVTVGRDAPAVFRFRARVPDGGPAAGTTTATTATSAKITFTAGTAAGDPELTDAVEVTLPVLPPTILRRESVAGTLPTGAGGSGAGRGAADTGALLPEDARRPGAVGRYDVAFSTSPDLPRLRGLPAILEYPHGCFEQITSRVLAYCGVHDLLQSLPADPDQDARWRRDVERALNLCARSLLDDGRLPYWPGGKAPNPFVTVQAAWAAREATAAGFTVDPDLSDKLDGALKKMTAGDNKDAKDAGADVPPFVRAFALLVQATRGGNGEADGDDGGGEEAFNADAARAVFNRRETLGDEGRALLAVALHRAKVMPAEKSQLLREIFPLAAGTRPAPERAFDPPTFGSGRRAEAIALWAFAEVRPPEWKNPADLAAARARLGKLLDRAPANSTQENLWSLFASHALRKAENAPKLRAVTRLRPPPTRVSPDGTAAEWTGLKLGEPAFRPPADLNPAANAALFTILTAEYRVGRAEEDTRRDRGGLRVERVVRNLTDPARTGRPGETPVRVNDRLLVTYRLQSPKPRAFVALEDELPAGLEAVNPELPLFAPFYELPPTAPGERTPELSSSQLRDHATLLYFDRLEPGVSAYPVLVRAAAAGSFRWPATQAGPMYEPTVGGLAPSGEIIVAAE